MSFSKVPDPYRDAQYIDFLIKNDRFLPYDTGNLRNNVSVRVQSYYKSKEVKIFLNGKKVPYAVYLEEGTQPHDIPHAFGYGTTRDGRPNPYTKQEPFGVGGRFNGKFHPGSIKHKGFVEYVMLHDCFKYLETAYDVIKIVSGSKLW